MGKWGGGLLSRVWVPCGSVRGVWLVGLRDGLFPSWDVSCLGVGDVAVGFGGMVVEGGYFPGQALQVEEAVELVRKLLAVQRDGQCIVHLQDP